MPVIRSIKNACSRLYVACVAAFLLLSYILGSVDPQAFHSFSHHEAHANLHTAENEADPCHVSIYHGESTHACEHETHFTEESKCSLCDVHLHVSAHIYVLNTFETLSINEFQFFVISSLGIPGNSVSLLQGRGPPSQA